MTRSELAIAYRIPLVALLAPDRRCASCGRFHAIEDLEIDHVRGRTWACRRLNFLDRIRRQWREYLDGVQLRAACRSCNASDGTRRFRGRRRYEVAYRRRGGRGSRAARARRAGS